MDIVSYSRVLDRAPSPRVQAARPDSGVPRSADDGGDRISWVDTSKGICIILVVMMHSTLGVGDAMGGEGFMHWVVAFAKPFRMPDFFLISGLFLSRVIDRDWRVYGDKRVVHFVYFYALWLLIQSTFKYGLVSDGSPMGYLGHLVQGLWEPYSTLWFIYILAIFSAVTKLLKDVPRPIVFAAAAALQILPIESPSFLFDQFCERWVYFLAGYMFAPQVFRLAAWAGGHRYIALAGILAWALAEGAFALTPTRFELFPTLAELPVLGLVLGLVGALAIVTIASVVTRFGIAGPLRYCGRNSISIYLAFFLPMAAMRSLLVKTGWIGDIGTVSLIVTAFGVAMPLVLERLVRDTRLSFLFRRPAWAHLRPAPPTMRMVPAE